VLYRTSAGINFVIKKDTAWAMPFSNSLSLFDIRNNGISEHDYVVAHVSYGYEDDPHSNKMKSDNIRAGILCLIHMCLSKVNRI